MSITKKAISVGLSAAMLASLAATVVAPAAALAANTSSNGGTITPGGADSTAASITFAEDNTSQPYNQFSDGSFTVALLDSAGAATIHFDTSSTPTITVNSGVGSATAAYVGGNLVVTVSGTDTTKLDSFTIGNLKVYADAGAALGAIQVNVTADTVGLSQALVTASGTVGTAVIVGATSAAVTLNAGSPGFQPTNTTCTGGALKSGNVNFAAYQSSVAESIVAEAGTTGGTVNYSNGGTGFTAAHPVGTPVTQQVCAAAFPSIATVGDAVAVSLKGSTATWNAGVSRQDLAGGAYVNAQLGFFNNLLASGATVTFTITTPGVTFSTNTCTIVNCWDYHFNNGTIGNPTLNGTATALTFTLPGASSAGDYIDIYSEFDVASTVAAGTPVKIAVTTSGSVTVTGSPVTIAYVGNLVVGVSTVPNVLIGTTNQSAGVITLTESAAGSFTDSKPIQICLESNNTWSSGTYFWAVVTKGDLKLNINGLPATQGLLTMANPFCLQVLDYTASTVASTIEIHTGSATAPAAGGPMINVWPSNVPGPAYVDVTSGGNTIASNVVIAMMVFGGSPSATALSQLAVVPGKLMQNAGSIQISEGAPGAFGPGMTFWLCIVDNAHNENTQVTWSNSVGANAPVVTTNYSASGLLAHYVSTNSYTNCIQVAVDSSSLVTLGVITISNLHFDVVSDAIAGPVYVEVYNGAYNPPNVGGPSVQSQSLPAKSLIDQYVSNATITNPSFLDAASASGVTTSGPFTISTKVVKKGTYVTIMIKTTPAMAGAHVGIYIAKKVNGVWTKFSPHTGRIANGSGVVYYYYKAGSVAWLSIRGYFTGDSSHAPAWSNAVQVRFVA